MIVLFINLRVGKILAMMSVFPLTDIFVKKCKDLFGIIELEDDAMIW